MKIRILSFIAALGCTAPLALGQASLPVNIGELVHTFEAPNSLGQTVVTLVDTRLPAATPTGVNLTPPIFWNQGAGAHEWTLPNLGHVFGVTLDASYPNIYVTAADGLIVFPQVPLRVFGPLGPGGVYRLDGATGNICHLATLPNHPTSGPGLGNITFSARTNSLYVSNFEDGMIYRLSLGPSAATPVCPAVVPPPGSPSIYDHGVRTGLFPDNGTPGLTQLGRRVWGVAVHPGENRLYYGVWWRDRGNPNAARSNEVWSVALNAAGDAGTQPPRLEFALPAYLGNYSSPVAGLNFTHTGNLLVGERSVTAVAHESRLLEYSGGTTAWAPVTANVYWVGVNGTSCTGVGEMDCAGNVWTVGDGIIRPAPNSIYGMMRIPAGGNGGAAHTPPAFHTSLSYLIDSDRDILSDDKTQVGSLVYRKDCTGCPLGGVSSPFPNSPADQRCGELAAGGVHYSIDSIGLVNNPGGYVSVGSRLLPSGLPGLHVIRWTREGNILRQALFASGTANESIIPTSVEVDANCNVLIAGKLQAGSSFSTFAARLDPLFVPVWVSRIPGNMSGGENVQADWLSDGGAVVSGMDGTGATPRIGRLTRLTGAGALIWSKRYTSTMTTSNPRFIIEDVEQAANGNIWVCGGVEWPNGANFTILPMIMEVHLGPVSGAAPGGLPVGFVSYVYPFPVTSPQWVTGGFKAIKFNPTPNPNLGDVVVAGWSSRTTGGPLPETILATRVAHVDSVSHVAHWDNVYPSANMIPGTSALSIAPTSSTTNKISVAGRTFGGFGQTAFFGVTLRVNEAFPGLFSDAQRHGSPSIPDNTYAFQDLTPGSSRVMVGGYSNIQPFGGGGGQLWFSPGNCPTPFTSTHQSVANPPIFNGELSVAAEVISTMTLVEVPVATPCSVVCRRCYANCDGSTISPILNVQDFACFLNAFAAGDPLANCDDSFKDPILNVQDFACFLNAFAAGCE